MRPNFFMRTTALLRNTILLGIVAAAALPAADFSFYAVLRAGATGASEWELGIGNNSSSLTTSQFSWNVGTPLWPNNTPANFRIGYTNATNTAYVTVYDSGNNAVTASFNPLKGGGSAAKTWQLPASSMFVSAGPTILPESIQVNNLTVNGGVNVLQPISFTSMAITKMVGATTSTLSEPSPVSFKSTTASGGQDWYIGGQIQFAGLGFFVPNGAQGNQLLFSMTANATNATPEPGTFGLATAGLALAWWWRGRRQKAVSL
jgi:hypothetical protein